jgi:diguanylate cyclase (GGDEF)-like protein
VYAAWTVTGFGGEQGLRYLSGISFQIAPMAATAACAFVGARTSGRERVGWALFGLGIGCWSFAEWIWASYDLFFNAEVPLFSYADPLYYAGYPLLMVGAGLLIVPERRSTLTTKSLLDALLLVAVLAVVTWRWVWIPIYQQTDEGAFGLLVTLGYPVLDFALAVVIIFSFYRGNSVLEPPAVLLVFGTLATAVADGVYLYLATVRGYDVYGNPTELGWVVGYLAFGLAGLARLDSLEAAKVRGGLTKQQRDLVGIALPYAALLPMMAVFAIDLGRAAPNSTLSVGLIAAVILVTLRQFLTLQDVVNSRAELERVNDQLQESMSAEHHLARTDALTGIPNRRLLDETVETEVARAMRYGRKLSILMVDLDDLKRINDKDSHQRGDEALQVVARSAREACRQADLVGRFGGDEFVIVTPSTDSAGAALLAERFQAALREYSSPSGVPVTVSIGVAEWDGRVMSDAASLLSAADNALYVAKAAGKNRYAVAEPVAAAA